VQLIGNNNPPVQPLSPSVMYKFIRELEQIGTEL